MKTKDSRKPTDAEMAEVETIALLYQVQVWDFSNRRWVNQGKETKSQDFAKETERAVNSFGVGRTLEIRKEIRPV